jgi:hypothetical protein
MVRNGPGSYSPARFGAEGSLEKYLIAAGFESVRRNLRAFPIEFESFEEYWQTLGVAMILGPEGDLPLRAAPEIREALRLGLAQPPNGNILLFNEAALILARKPG